MARTSFRLRRATGAGDAVGVGSYVRGTDALQAEAGASVFDQDSALRSTGIITALPTAELSTFSGTAVTYNSVLLDWLLEEPFTPLEDIGSGESGLIGVALVYSKTGYPETVLDGKTVFSGALNSYLHQETISVTTDQGVITYKEPEAGKWAYYSLFAYFNNDGANGDFFYERLASIEVLVPNDYGSRLELWNRVPLYYRESDKQNDNQLERYLDTFGFEVDRTRTLIDAVMTQYDPTLTEAEGIREIASMLGLSLNVEDIGVSRTRALLKDIGFLRKQKGTMAATKGYLTAVSGSEITVFTGASAPYYTFAVHAERANLVADPRFIGSRGTTWEVYSENAASVSVAPAEGITITAGASPTQVAIVCTQGVPMDADHTYYMSADFSETPDAVYAGLWGAGASWNDWSTVTVSASVPTGIAGRLAYSMEPAASGTKYPVFLLGLASNQSLTLSRWMVEPNKIGSFFDGATVFSGYLYQNYQSDHIWSGTAYASYSLYSTNRKKTQDAIERLLPRILPVTMLGTESGQPKYEVVFDWIPGKPLT